MSIDTRCPLCGKDYQLADEQAGLRVRCRDCSTEFDVPRRAEVLQVVPKPPAGPRLAEPDEDEPLLRSVARQGPSNRALYWVAGILAATLILVALSCAGFIWMLTLQVQRTVEQVAQEVNKPPPVPPAPPPPAPPVNEPPGAAPPIVGGGKVEPKMPDLGGLLKLPAAPANMEEALKNLRSTNSLVRLKALEYIGLQPLPADAAQKKKIIDAVDAATKDDDPFVRLGATQLKLLWELDL